MIDILPILDNFIVSNISSIKTDDIIYNFDEKEGNRIILWQYDNVFTNLGDRPQVQITVKNQSMQTAFTTINAIYDIIFPEGNDQKTTIIDGKNYHFKPIQAPFYLEKDQNDLHTYVFNVDIVQNR